MNLPQQTCCQGTNKQTRQKEVILLVEKIQVSDKISSSKFTPKTPPHHDWNISASFYEQLPKRNL